MPATAIIPLVSLAIIMNTMNTISLGDAHQLLISIHFVVLDFLLMYVMNR